MIGGKRKGFPRLGSVQVCVVSNDGPKKMIMVLVKDLNLRPLLLWKNPGGGIEECDGPEGSDESLFAAAIREVWQETKIQLLKEELRLIQRQMRVEGGGYIPNVFIATVQREKIDGMPQFTESDGEKMQTGKFSWKEVLGMRDLLMSHRKCIEEKIGPMIF